VSIIFSSGLTERQLKTHASLTTSSMLEDACPAAIFIANVVIGDWLRTRKSDRIVLAEWARTCSSHICPGEISLDSEVLTQPKP
jgi:hypothetical protein